MGAQRILMGVIGRPHGVRGLLRVHSYTADPADLASYGTLEDDRGERWTLRWRGEGIAELRDGQGNVLTDRDRAAVLVNRKLFVERDRLPDPDDAEEFYLADLVGLAAVERLAGGGERTFGTVLAVHDYGAGASLEVGDAGRSELLPFTRLCVPEVDIAGGRVVVCRPDELDGREVVGPEIGEAAADGSGL
ncbi:ribosome maturation factor RimM [Rhizosaccharibacter radicis]|uniref:Ribosome maturation factor RimM n=1 Tax=Rhizosaccharibacter radicis TaxID=2782605 RepID=A0ABT1VYB6_9PROT|nr:ribosome maturation factor RimM [Acetobacteraceae bacterium KSS12]